MTDASPAIDIHIDVLALPEELAKSQTAIASAFRDELARLISESDTSLLAARNIEKLDCEASEIRLGPGGAPSEREAGIRLARAIHKGLGI